MHRRRRHPWSLRVSILLAMLGLVLLTAVATTLILYLNSRSTVVSAATRLLEEVAQQVRQEGRLFLEPVSAAPILAQRIINARGLGTDDLDALETVFFALMEGHPQISAMHFGDPSGNHLQLLRQPDGSLDTRVIRRSETGLLAVWRERLPGTPVQRVVASWELPREAYDPRQRPWYQLAVAARELAWTPVYRFARDHNPGITVAGAVRDPAGGLLGAIGASTSLSALSEFLEDLRLGRDGEAFVADRDGRVVAMPGMSRRLLAWGSVTSLPLLSDSGNPLLAAIAATGGFQAALAERRPATLGLNLEGREILAVVEPLERPSADWVIGAAMPAAELLRGVQRGSAEALGAALLVLIAAGILAAYIAHRITQPLGYVVDETRHIRHLEFTDRPAPNLVFRELVETVGAFRDMKQGLRAFERYAPTDLVRKLLETHTEATPGAQLAELTLMFSDIRDFSAYAESHSPQQVSENLARYLNLMTEVLSRHAGTVDKYVGDGIMCFWNAPRRNADHAGAAVAAALSCLQALREADMPEFHTRIGIHTGRVMVGNFGSEHRLNYTAIGDNVNLAARLEAVNKLYGTQLLISEPCQARLQGRFECRLLDHVQVKGKTAITAIYEVLGPRGAVAPERLRLARRYEQALACFRGRDFGGCLKILQALLETTPGDGAARLLHHRAQGYLAEPPPRDWSGAHPLASK